MARTRPSDILAALDRIYSHRERKEQLEQDRSFKMMEMNYRERAREDQQAFQKEEARDSWNRDFKTKYPGAIMQEDGYFGVPEGYDYTQSASFKSGQAINVEEDLRKFGLDTSGTSQERQNRLSVYQQAQGKGANMMQPTVSPDVAIRMGGDLTPNYFTQKDISDFQDFYDGSGGSDSPIALQQIVDAGIINADKLTLDPDTGLYQADDNAKALINVAFQGLKSGALKNESFMTNRQYEQYTDEQRQENMLYAESLTGHPYVAQATNIFNSTKQSIGAKRINAQITEGGDYTIQWKGEQVELNDVMNAIDAQKGVFTTETERANFKAFMQTIATVGSDGSGMETVLLEANSNPQLLKLLAKFDRSLAKGIVTAQHQFNRIDKISRTASSFIQSPEAPGEVTGFRKLVQNTGLSERLQQLRTVEAEGGTNSSEWQSLDKEIQEIVKGLAMQLQGTGDDTMLNDFHKWLQLEESTAELFKESAAKRRQK